MPRDCPWTWPFTTRLSCHECVTNRSQEVETRLHALASLRCLGSRDASFPSTAPSTSRPAVSIAATSPRDDDDRLHFLLLLAAVTLRTDWDCQAFCLMPNHHLVVTTHQDVLSFGLRYLNGRYAQAFNERHGRTGHLFGDRYAAFAIEDEAHLRHAVEYVLANPVRARLCRRARDWRWSGSRSALSSSHA